MKPETVSNKTHTLSIALTKPDIYFFGFSRGAYIARFLAEMLDYVGLLEPGNEEMVGASRRPRIKSNRF